MIHTTFHHPIQLIFQLGLIYIVLVLSNADGFGINLHQFAQRIQQSAADTDCATYCDIFDQEILRGQLPKRINRSPTFIYHKYTDRLSEIDSSYQLFGFAACRSITNRNSFNIANVLPTILIQQCFFPFHVAEDADRWLYYVGNFPAHRGKPLYTRF